MLPVSHAYLANHVALTTLTLPLLLVTLILGSSLPLSLVANLALKLNEWNDFCNKTLTMSSVSNVSINAFNGVTMLLFPPRIKKVAGRGCHGHGCAGVRGRKPKRRRVWVDDRAWIGLD